MLTVISINNLHTIFILTVVKFPRTAHEFEINLKKATWDMEMHEHKN